MTMTMSRHDSTLLWPETPAAMPVGGRSYTILCTPDPRAEFCAERWRDRLGDVESRVCRLTDSAPDALRLHVHAMVAVQQVGWRLGVVGDELTAVVCRAEALAAGLLDDEISVHAIGRTRLQMYCPHCRTLTVTTHSPGQTESCRGCQRELRIRPHLSQSLGAYLASDTATQGKERHLDDAHGADQTTNGGLPR